MKVLIAKIIREERGSVIVLVTLSMVLFLGMMALVADVGLAYVERVKLNNAVDAASLAGAQQLPRNVGEAENDARQYAALNGIDSGAGELLPVQIGEDKREITVSARRRVEFFFARVLGWFTGDLGASATATLEPGMGVMPIGILRDDWETNFGHFSGEDEEHEIGQEYVLKGKSHTSASPNRIPGWYGGLRAPGEQGAKDFCLNIAWGIDEIVEVNDILMQEPGVMSGPTAVGANIRIGLCDQCQLEDLIAHFRGDEEIFSEKQLKECPRIIIVPIVEETEVNKAMRICSFELFYLLEVRNLGPQGQGTANSEVIGVYLGPYEQSAAKSHFKVSLIR